MIYLGVCLIAAVRLAREENWNDSPRISSKIGDSIEMAEQIYKKVMDRVPIQM